jgi:hypothetical protein
MTIHLKAYDPDECDIDLLAARIAKAVLAHYAQFGRYVPPAYVILSNTDSILFTVSQLRQALNEFDPDILRRSQHSRDEFVGEAVTMVIESHENHDNPMPHPEQTKALLAKAVIQLMKLEREREEE